MDNRKLYEVHLRRWNRAREQVLSYNRELVAYWHSIPWWKFWIKKPYFEEQRMIILDNWSQFNRLPVPKLAHYFPLKIR